MVVAKVGCWVSHLNVLREKLRLLDETALLEDHLVDLEFCHVVDWAHSVVHFLLALVSD